MREPCSLTAAASTDQRFRGMSGASLRFVTLLVPSHVQFTITITTTLPRTI